MHKKNILITILILSAAVFISNTYAGGDRRNGSGGAQELLIPVGARGLATSGSYVAGLQGIESLFYNPAGLGAMNNTAQAA